MLAAVDFWAHWYVYLSMPLAGAFVGWVTKLVAIEMMYRPLEFRGPVRPWLGWQGMIPRRAAKMASIAVDMFVGRLVKPEELFERIDPAELAKALERPLLQSIERLTEEIAREYHPGVWEAMPDVARRALVRRLHAQAPTVIANLTASVRDNLETVFDLKHMVVTNLVADKALLCRIFREGTRPGMRFIVRAGAAFGFVIGLAQMATYVLTEEHWVLPVYGLITGSLTDWVALNMCFRPMERRRYLGLLRWQGLFHAEREFITEKYGALLAHDILTPPAILESLLTGPASDRLFDLVQREVQRTIDAQTGIARPLVVLAVGGRQYQELKRRVAERVIAEIPITAHHADAYAREALDIENTVVDRMRTLSPEQYEGLLRPAIKDDEWVVVAVGAALGFVVGELQVLLLTSLV